MGEDRVSSMHHGAQYKSVEWVLKELRTQTLHPLCSPAAGATALDQADTDQLWEVSGRWGTRTICAVMLESWAGETWDRETQPLIRVYPRKLFSANEVLRTNVRHSFIYNYMKCWEHPRM